MTTLTVTARGQVTFRKDVLKHLGIKPGGKIRLDLLPDGRAELTADQPQGSWEDLRNFSQARRMALSSRSRSSIKSSLRRARRPACPA